MTTRLINPALAPSILAVIVLLAGLALVTSDAYLYIRFGVSILAAIVVVFAVQYKKWAWMILPAIVAVVFNPLFVVELRPEMLAPASLLASAAMLATGLFFRAPERERS